MTGFAGRHAGTDFLNARYQDPVLGAFISVDPLVGMTGSAYAYSRNNPITFSDPTGLCECFSPEVTSAATVAESYVLALEGWDQSEIAGWLGERFFDPDSHTTRFGVDTQRIAGGAVDWRNRALGSFDDVGSDGLGWVHAMAGAGKGARGGRGGNQKATEFVKDTVDDLLEKFRDPNTDSSTKQKIKKELKARGQRASNADPTGKSNSVEVDLGDAAAATGGGVAIITIIWWGGKLLSPLCGPAAPACAVVL